MKKQFILFLMLLFLVETQAVVRYVTPNGSGNLSGVSWADASNDLQLMINNSVTGDTIWTAAGTYLPIRPADNLGVVDSNNRDNAFVLKADVLIFGGFAGNETSISQRDWNTNLTILSGDIGVPNDSTDNCYHVVISAGPVGIACLDGFTVTKGNADVFSTITVNSNPISSIFGGGMFNSTSSPTLTNLTISGNIAAAQGGGMQNSYSASPTLTNVTISGNKSGNYGGGMDNDYSSPTLINVVISGNNAQQGGGIYNYATSSPVLTNVIISGNNASNGGGIYNISSASPVLTNVIISGNNATTGEGGGMCNNIASPTLTDVIISGNSANTNGGGIANTTSSSTFTNVTIIGNHANGAGGGMYNTSGTSSVLTNVTISGNYGIMGGGMCNMSVLSYSVRNSIIWGNTATSGNNVSNFTGAPTYSYSIVEGSSGGWGSFGTDGGNNLDANPLFVAPVSASLAPTTAGDYRLQLGSPAIDTGENAYVGLIADLDGNTRISGCVVDMGAYEYQWIYLPDTIQLSPLLFTYNGTGQSPAVTIKNGTPVASIVYKEKGASDLTYTSTLPVNAGNYTIRASLPPNGKCDITDTADFVILPKQLTISSSALTKIKVYDGNTD
ncbi:MAG: hypothetical protein FWH36_03760, partial [Lentimicrobiaceae bacterium]|nr:hypothetical protein [Lentimicrobiaceae bacterium]